MREQRNYIRYKIEGKATVKSEQEPQHTFTAEIENISYGGFCIVSQKPLAPQTAVLFELVIPHLQKSICGKGEVKNITQITRWTATCARMGIEFKEVDKNLVTAAINISLMHKRKKGNGGGVPYFGEIA